MGTIYIVFRVRKHEPRVSSNRVLHFLLISMAEASSLCWAFLLATKNKKNIIVIQKPKKNNAFSVEKCTRHCLLTSAIFFSSHQEVS